MDSKVIFKIAGKNRGLFNEVLKMHEIERMCKPL